MHRFYADPMLSDERCFFLTWKVSAGKYQEMYDWLIG